MVFDHKPIKTFSKQRFPTTMSINKKKAEEHLRATDQDINDVVTLFNLNDDARAKLEVIPLKVFTVVQETFAPPVGCDNNSGMIIGFAASICKRMGFQQKENRPGKRMLRPEPSHVDNGGGAPVSKARLRTGKGGTKGNSGATSDVSSFVQIWGLYPKCTPQINALPRNLRSFVLKHFRSDSPHESQINSQFQEFVKDLNALEIRRTTPMAPPSRVEYEEDDFERPESAQVDDFCMLYNLNADARGKLDQLSSKSLETVMQEFVLPAGVTECNGILINFANSVEKKLTGKGKGRGGKGRKRLRN